MQTIIRDKKYVSGNVVRTVDITKKGVTTVSYNNIKRYIHQRDGRINQAKIRRENIETAILHVPGRGKQLGAMKQDIQILSKHKVETILLFDIFLSSDIIQSFSSILSMV